MSEPHETNLENQQCVEDIRGQRVQKSLRMQEAGLNIYGARVEGISKIEELRQAFLALPEDSEENCASRSPDGLWPAASWANPFSPI